MEKEIRHMFSLPHPPDVVWEHLTKSELLAQWLTANDFKPVIGHKFQFKTRPKPKLGFDGIIYCEVLEIVPFQKLSYSWKGGLSKENPSLDSIVTWTLTPTGNGTDLLLEHKGFKGIKNYFTYVIMNMGWIKNGKKLARHLNLTKHGTTSV